MTVWSLVGIDTGLVASGNISPQIPAEVQEGDLLIAHISYRDAAEFSAPAGGEWTIHEQQSLGNTSTTVGASIASGMIASCIRGASNPGTVFTRTGGDVAMGRITAWRPDAGTVEFVGSSSNTLAANSTTVTTGELTASGADNLLILGYCGANNVGASEFRAATDPTTQSGNTDATTGSITVADTWVEIYDSTTTIGADTRAALARAVKTAAGATGELRITAEDSNRHVAVAGAWRAVTGGDATADGAAVTAGATLVAGSADGGSAAGNASGAALTVGITAAAGAATGEGSGTGSSFAIGASLAAGTATAGGAGTGSGTALALGVAISAGAGTGQAAAVGVALTTAATLAAGSATGAAATTAASLQAVATIEAGTATGSQPANVDGSNLGIAVALLAGTAEGEAQALGAALAIVAAVAEGIATGAALQDGSAITAGLTFYPGLPRVRTEATLILIT